MDKWYGKVGYSVSEETRKGLWESTIVERYYYGNILNSRWKRQTSDSVNDNINLANVISIVSDPFANKHCSSIVYVEYMGTKWKVTDVEPQFPRLSLTIGGVYNE